MDVDIALLALLTEVLIGYPDWLVTAIGHPVTWIGRLISIFDRVLNREGMMASSRRLTGILALTIVVAIAALAGLWVERILLVLPLGFIPVALIASSLIAQKSLERHVRAVADALEKDGLAAARVAVSRIVGRDTWVLDQAGVARAAIESLAENFSDGVIAPAFWLALLGLPGAAAYKAINTADSMIGHRTPRHEAFGWAAAKIDDLVNLPASRLSALLIVAAAAVIPTCSAREAWRAVWRDAGRHRSPNAGYPEAAMAGALGLALAGPRSYGGVKVDDALMGDGRREAVPYDIRAAIMLYQFADFLLIVLVAVVALIITVAR
jgi:adenosylcobinamide-phosphate synthase